MLLIYFPERTKTTIRILKMIFNTLGFLPTFSSLFEGVSAVRSNCFRIGYQDITDAAGLTEPLL